MIALRAICLITGALALAGQALGAPPPMSDTAVQKAILMQAEDDSLKAMQDEIQLREELSAGLVSGLGPGEEARLRMGIGRLEEKRRSADRIAVDARKRLATIDDRSGAAARTPGEEFSEPLDDRPQTRGTGTDIVESLVDAVIRSRRALLIFGLALMFRLAAGSGVRRWLAKRRAGVKRRPERDGIDPQWLQAKRFLLIGASLAIFGTAFVLILVDLDILGTGGLILVAMLLGAVLLFLRNPIQDAVNGLTLLCEHRYDVGDLIDLESCSGVVEAVSLRTTTLRDIEGTLHFVPHRRVSIVGNKTYDWARAVMEVLVAPEADIDHAMEVILKVMKDVAEDAKYREMILDQPQVLGVDRFEASGAVVKFLVKTQSQKKSLIRREIQRRLKKRFAELGIEMPFRRHTLFHRIPQPEGEQKYQPPKRP